MGIVDLKPDQIPAAGAVLSRALFQMWQTQIGAGSFEGAFIYAVSSGLVLLFVNNPDQ